MVIHPPPPLPFTSPPPPAVTGPLFRLPPSLPRYYPLDLWSQPRLSEVIATGNQSCWWAGLHIEKYWPISTRSFGCANSQLAIPVNWRALFDRKSELDVLDSSDIRQFVSSFVVRRWRWQCCKYFVPSSSPAPTPPTHSPSQIHKPRCVWRAVITRVTCPICSCQRYRREPYINTPGSPYKVKTCCCSLRIGRVWTLDTPSSMTLFALLEIENREGQR